MGRVPFRGEQCRGDQARGLPNAERGISEAEAEAQMLADSGVTKIGEPEDEANLVAYMVSPHDRYLHGALIDLDGGTTKTM